MTRGKPQTGIERTSHRVIGHGLKRNHGPADTGRIGSVGRDDAEGPVHMASYHCHPDIIRGER